jgi:RNA polymerase sigma-70 factor
MTQDSRLVSPQAFSEHFAGLIGSLYADANGARWGLSRESFAEGLRCSAERRFRGANGSATEVEEYLKSLHLEDLALARACVEGADTAWEFFVAHFRQGLRDASRAILRASGSGNDVRADELADSLYAELYGVRTASGERRKSLFEYFHGRSKLSTWLRSVLSQRRVDLLRADRGLVSLDTPTAVEEDAPQAEFAQPGKPDPADPDRTKYLACIDMALSAAFAGLTPRDRMLLAFYYVDQLTLGEIGRTLGEHESTVSRQLDRTRRALRETVTELLRRGKPALDGRAAVPRLDEAQIELAFEYALEDWPFDLSQALSKAEAAADPPKT